MHFFSNELPSAIMNRVSWAGTNHTSILTQVPRKRKRERQANINPVLVVSLSTDLTLAKIIVTNKAILQRSVRFRFYICFFNSVHACLCIGSVRGHSCCWHLRWAVQTLSETSSLPPSATAYACLRKRVRAQQLDTYNTRLLLAMAVRIPSKPTRTLLLRPQPPPTTTPTADESAQQAVRARHIDASTCKFCHHLHH